MTHQLQDLIEKSRVVIMLGAGGVGKTTTSILMAIAAAKAGKKVGLISVDPAKRLADALGITLSAELSRIQLPADWTKTSGYIDAAMLDQKSTLDSLIRKFTKNEKTRQKIFENSLYKSAADKIGGALEYMAMAKLGELIGDDQYDLIVVDTPPDLHALDFLVRPNFLARFVENRVMRWFIKPIYYASRLNARFLNQSIIEKVVQITGLNLLREIADFFVNMQETINGLYETSKLAQRMIASPQTSLIFVAGPSERVIRSLDYVVDQTRELNLALKAIIVNRCLPKDVAAILDKTNSSSQPDEIHYDPLTNLRRRRLGEQAFFSALEKSTSGAYVKALTELNQNPHNWEGLEALSAELERT